jgi:peptide/nickel transport system permease protein
MTDLIDTYASPSSDHLLGTDGSGMDLMVRLMYGGRVSLTIGFVVVLIEMLIGIIIGGLSGYFGGWVDTLLMRLVEIFNCIPTMPIYYHIRCPAWYT